MGRSDPPRRRPLRWPWSFRTRILAWYVALLAIATAASILVVREILDDRLDQRLQAELTQETRELERLARGDDPETGAPFATDVARIFDVYLERNVPSRNEAFFTFVAGAPYRVTPRDPPVRLDRDASLVDRWARLDVPDRGGIDSSEGRIEYLAVPLRSREETRGVFVVASFRDAESASSQAAFWAAGAVGLAVLLIGSLLAWRVASRVLDPVETVTATARRITEGDLSERIPVRGRDEVAQLAQTFNEMLDRLETAFAMQRRLLDDVGHELRTPITIVRGHLELLGTDPEEQAETKALALDELDRMTRMVNDLLLLARSEQPDFLKPDAVDLAALTDDLYAKATAIAERDWRLEERASGTIVADSQRLTQAVVQLAQNAVQHTDEGASILIGSSLENGEARLWVHDSGPGIPPDELTRIFDRFAQGAETRETGGAGLGLSIVDAIARAHHGEVVVASRPGAGARFTLVVPTGGLGR